MIEGICAQMAKIIVNEGRIEEMHEVNMTSLRKKYIKVSELLAKMEKLDIKVNRDNPVRELLRHIQKERGKQKKIKMFAFRLWLYYGKKTEESESFGDNKVQDRGAGGDDGRVCCERRVNGLNQSRVKNKRKRTGAVNHKKEDVVESSTQEVDDEDDIVLYGMIST